MSNRKQNRPSEQYPELVDSLAKASYYIRLAHDELSGGSMSKKLDVSRTAYNNKIRRMVKKGKI